MSHRKQQNGPPALGRFGVFWRMVLAAAVACGLAPVASAQFLRLGIFDVAMEAGLEFVYTTNVEGERPSQATAEMEDYYIVPALSLTGEAPFGRGTKLSLDTSFGMEKHFVRTDLDNDSAPFGRLRLDSRTEMGRYSLGAYAGIEREFAEEENIYVPRGFKQRDITDTIEYGGDLSWAWRNLEMKGAYDHSSERHRSAEFAIGDKDETSMAFDARLDLRQDLSANYGYERTLTELINDPDDAPGWETTETITLDWKLPIWERPTITYGLGVERESEDGVPGDWELTHTVNVDGEWEVFPMAGALRLSLHAAYDYERDPEEQDIAFTYGADLDHELATTARQRLTLKREPVETFGSDNETDNTTVDYTFTKDDLFIYNLQLILGVMWTRDEPMEEGSEVERKFEYRVALNHSQALSRKLVRDIRYEYTREDSDLETELLIEHRVTVAFTYTF